MKNISSTLTYILTFVALTGISFGVTFGVLTFLNPDEPEEDTTTAIIDTKDEAAGEEEITESDWRSETIFLSDLVSFNTRVPQDWTIHPHPASEETGDSLVVDLKSPEITHEDGSGLGIHFCLSLSNITTLSPADQALIDAPVELDTTIAFLGNIHSLHYKSLPEQANRPLLVASSDPSPQSSTSYIAGPNDTFISVTGMYGCRDDNPEANIDLTVPEFATKPEVTIAQEILTRSDPLDPETSEDVAEPDSVEATVPDIAPTP